MDRPDTADFWRLSDLVRALDAQSALHDEGRALSDELERHVDSASAEYIAFQRALRVAQHVRDHGPGIEVLVSALTACWLEGFICGRRFPEPVEPAA